MAPPYRSEKRGEIVPSAARCLSYAPLRISALQLQAQLGLGSYKSAWLLLTKLRRAMVDPERSLLEDVVETFAAGREAIA